MRRVDRRRECGRDGCGAGMLAPSRAARSHVALVLLRLPPFHASCAAPASQDLQRRLAKHTEEESKRTAPMTLRTRLIVVSNRLPVTVRRDEDTGEWEFAVSSGGEVPLLDCCQL